MLARAARRFALTALSRGATLHRGASRPRALGRSSLAVGKSARRARIARTAAGLWWGVVSVECSVAGHFFRNLPAISAVAAPLCPNGAPHQPKYDHLSAMHGALRAAAPSLLGRAAPLDAFVSQSPPDRYCLGGRSRPPRDPLSRCRDPIIL